MGVSLTSTTTERLLALANAVSPHGAVLVNAEGRIVFANPAITRILGWQEEDLVGKPVEVLIPERLRGNHHSDRAAFQRAPRAREMGAGRELSARCKDGGELPVEVGLNPVDTDGGRYTLATLVDLSARREMAQRMVAAEQLASLGTLAASVAHEVNNPNAFITANLESLQGNLTQITHRLAGHPELAAACAEDLEEARAAIEDSLEGVRRVTSIVAQLRVLTRTPQDNDPRAECSLNDIVRWAGLLVQGQVLERARLDFQLAASIPSIEGYSGQLSQVVTNLLTNACQAIPDGSPAENYIRVTTERRGEHVRLTVEDTGGGMDAQTREHAFRRFFTTKPIGEGSGLGLPISREIVEAHGGALWLEPRGEVAGTRAVVELPLRHRSSPPSIEAVVPMQTIAETHSRILIVDDDPAIRRAYGRVLKPHTVVGVDGMGAWQRFSEGDRDYDMVVCDVTMPMMDGPGLLERVQRHWPRLAARFVFSTGGAVTARTRALIDGMTHRVLFKPVTREALLEALHTLHQGERNAAC